MTQSTEPLTQLDQLTQLDLKKLSQRYEKAHPKDILTWCITNIPQGLVQTSTFNLDDVLITDLLYRDLQPVKPVPVLFLDTLHHFKETLALVEQAKHLYQLNLNVYKITTVESDVEFAAKYGEVLWDKDIELFSQLTKIEPLQRGLDKLGAIAWITGRRRDQASSRTDMPIFEFDKQGRLKVNPLANWARKETWAYVFEHDIIYNPLYDQGYSSIGDRPTTTPVQEGETERAGRWRGVDGKLESGIHF